MIILPAIDLKDGKCVRLYKGQLDKKEVVAEDPIKTAISFKEAGAEYIHLVDLDGAFSGNSKNVDIAAKIVSTVGLPVEFGGGIRSMDKIEFLINSGIERVILGTAALNNKELLYNAVSAYGDRVAVGIDAKDGKVAIEGWVNVSDIDYLEFAKQIEQLGVKTIIFTDISRDGTLTGPNMEQLIALKKVVSMNIIASGGIKDINHIRELSKTGVYGAITGKAIYSGTLSLVEAIKVGR